MGKIRVGFNPEKARAVKDALAGLKNETLRSIAEEFRGEDAITGGEWVKVKTKFSNGGSIIEQAL